MSDEFKQDAWNQEDSLESRRDLQEHLANSFICIPRRVGYTLAIRRCVAFHKFMEEMARNELEESEGNND